MFDFPDFSGVIVIGELGFLILAVYLVVIYLIQWKIKKATFISIITCDMYILIFFIMYFPEFLGHITFESIIYDFIDCITISTFLNAFLFWIPLVISIILEIMQYKDMKEKNIYMISSKKDLVLLIVSVTILLIMFLVSFLNF